MNIFQEVTQEYGSDSAQAAIAIIDRYVDTLYPNATGREHDPMSRAKRMTFARKLLDCAYELSISLDVMGWVLVCIIDNTDLSEYDPSIYYATTPRVMGYWLLEHPDLDMSALRDTPYQPVEVLY